MLYELGEVKSFDFAGNPSRSGARAAEGAAPSPLSLLLEMVFASNVVAHPHPAVQRVYLEIAYRYAQFLQQQQQHIPAAMQVIAAGRGRGRGIATASALAPKEPYKRQRNITKEIVRWHQQLHPCRRAGLLAGALSGSSLPYLSCDISTCGLHAGGGPVWFDGDRACPLAPLHRASTSFSPLYLISLPYLSTCRASCRRWPGPRPLCALEHATSSSVCSRL